jgi:hypothetical protein
MVALLQFFHPPLDIGDSAHDLIQAGPDVLGLCLQFAVTLLQ